MIHPFRKLLIYTMMQMFNTVRQRVKYELARHFSGFLFKALTYFYFGTIKHNH